VEKMVDFTSRYLTSSEGIEVHLTPEEVLVFQKNVSSDTKNFGYGNTNVHYLNQFGAEILLECSRRVTEQDLKHKLKQRVKKPEVISNFIEESIRRGIIRTEDGRSLRNLKITGSKQYFIPVHFAVELTPQCNLRCIYCYNESSEENNQRLPTPQFLTCLEELSKNGVRLVELTGGEPLTHPDFSDIISFCGTNFFLISILTNGTLVNAALAGEIAKYKKKVFVQVDLDGSTASVHDMLRGVPGSFEKAKKGIELLAKNSIFVKVVMNVLPCNVDDIEKTLLVAKQCGALMYSYSFVTDVGRARSLNLSWTPKQVANLQELPKYLYEKYGNFFFQLNEEQIGHFAKRRNCGAGYRSCVLGPTGEVRPCPLLPESCLTLGNLSNSSMEEIFRNPLVDYLSKLKAPSPETCPDCPYQVYCGVCFIKSFYVQEKTGTVCSWAKSSGLNLWLDPDKLRNQKKNYTACSLPSRDKTTFKSVSLER
jgi:radical SAM protein with 4Fe4S-binding SPASM domain